jgi:hypothetical protein
MNTTPAFTELPVRSDDPEPVGYPARLELVRDMLARTKRHGTPIRSSFVQLPQAASRASRASVLAKFNRSKHLDAFLFIHALASAKEPYEATYPAGSWAHALGLDESTGIDEEDLSTAKTQWSKIVRKLQDLGLIKRRRSGNYVSWVLLNESGDGSEFIRPKKAADGHWFVLPEEYWLDGYDQSLSLPAKVMLLVALSSKPGFALPMERAKEWYGISRSTAQRGFKELEECGILTFEKAWRLDPSNPRMWSEERHYHLVGAFDQDVIRAAMSSRRSGRNAVRAAVPALQVDDVPTPVATKSSATRRRKQSSKEGGDKK